ncbi:MAG: flagellar protein FlgN [Terrisporobacter othiniensis]|uniref:Flagellar protein FlgN n=2 Tax=Terrisporobacter TaxID=1505652 RepID=A0AAX2ZHC6_9FIRM|nr:MULTISPECIES: flagellar protein FlgN [Terrisporobacter]MBN9647237.1 flagellar protein FlgN [Terrisporobacter glycolicus]MDU4860337.1 flagellar protein FlgN [Terrisporobacter othiniensis]MDU6993434.1 flagellar protein FlgN [Terrisporobacter othiniensis]UEL48587.1 flagellar protein FlgN [Terrisporobacter hibernicus]UPA31396.1 flagellar protein FlgN [Terrisporobacter glycolicus]
MNSQLKVVIFEEKNIIKNLLTLLDEQYNLIIDKDVIKMDKIAKELDESAKNLARIEIKRRNIMGSESSMKEVVEASDDEKIKQAYEEIQATLKMIEIQKEANEILIKQRLFFTQKMINCIKPNKGIGTYNAYGQVGK